MISSERRDGGGEGEERGLRKGAEKCLVDVPYPPLQIVNSDPFCLFSLYFYPRVSPEFPTRFCSKALQR